RSLRGRSGRTRGLSGAAASIFASSAAVGPAGAARPRAARTEGRVAARAFAWRGTSRSRSMAPAEAARVSVNSAVAILRMVLPPPPGDAGPIPSRPPPGAVGAREHPVGLVAVGEALGGRVPLEALA